MKKILSIAVLAIILIAALATCVSAATKSEALNQIYAIGAPYGMTESDKVKLGRYLDNNDVTDEEATALIGKAQEIAAIFEEAGATKYTDLTQAQKDAAKAILADAAKLVDVSVVFKTKSADIYKDGKHIDTIYESSGKLSYTGNEVNVALVAGTVAVIALAAVVLVKRTANAR